jgi:CRP-like cAMP-binding protein
MSIEDEIAFLTQVPMLRRLGEGALRSLAIASETYTMASGEVLFGIGETADGAYNVQRGSVTLAPEPGALLGESALLAVTKRPATATAREPCTVLRIARSTFLKILDSYPDAAARLRDSLMARSDQWAREMENVRAALARGRAP